MNLRFIHKVQLNPLSFLIFLLLVPEKDSTIEEDNVIEGTRKGQTPQKLSAVFKFNIGNSVPFFKALMTTTDNPNTTQRNKFNPSLTKSLLLDKTTPATIKNVIKLKKNIPETTTFIPRVSKSTKSTLSTNNTTKLQNLSPLFNFTLTKTKTKASEPLPKPLNERGAIKVKFGFISKNDSSHLGIRELKLRPLLKKSHRSFFDKKSFTVSPDIFKPTTPKPQENNNGAKQITNKLHKPDDIKPISPFLVPPLIQSPQLSLPTPRTSLVPPVRDSPSVFLVPPFRGPIVLHAENQEIRTPLFVSNTVSFSKPVHLQLPESQITPPRFNFSRSNRDFFIPSPGLQPPLPDNSLSDEKEENFDVPHRMTMTFPNRTMPMRRHRPFKINPNCPRCHPAFLRPNECQPCVIIK